MDDEQQSGWKLHEAQQRASWLRLSPTQRLAWLEEAKAFAQAAARAKLARPADGPTGER